MVIGVLYLAYEGSMWLFGDQETEEVKQADEANLPEIDSYSVVIG